MSGETFVVGTLDIAPDVSEERKAKIVDDFEGVLETDLVWDEQNKEYKVSHVNWLSHVREEDIKECYQKHKRHIKRISLSLWYLSEADFGLHVDQSEYALIFGLLYKRHPSTIKESAAYLFGTLLPPTRIAAEAGIMSTRDEILKTLEEKGEDWVVVAMIEGSIGYHSTGHTRRLINSIRG